MSFSKPHLIKNIILYILSHCSDHSTVTLQLTQEIKDQQISYIGGIFYFLDLFKRNK